MSWLIQPWNYTMAMARSSPLTTIGRTPSRRKFKPAERLRPTRSSQPSLRCVLPVIAPPSSAAKIIPPAMPWSKFIPCRHKRRSLELTDMKKLTLFSLFTKIAAIVLLLAPISISANPDDLFEADAGSGIIYKFTPAGTKSMFTSGINNPAGLAFDASANLFVAELNSGTIYKFTRTGTKTTFATGLNGPGGLAFDAAGNLFEGDSSGGTITKITPAGTKSTFASGLNGPGGLAFDSSGNLFEPDQFSGSIYKFTPAGTRTTFATLLQRPVALAFDVSGNLFESDRDSGNIFKFTPAGMQTTFASGLDHPVGLAFDSSGNLFEADRNTAAINKFTPGGTKTAFASGLNSPAGLAVQPGQLTNISTRLEVLTGNSVLIAGFIISGTDNKQVLVRSLGPTLTQFGVSGALADTTIELHNGAGAI